MEHIVTLYILTELLTFRAKVMISRYNYWFLWGFLCVDVLIPSQPIGIMSSAIINLTILLLGRLSPLSS